MKSFHEQILVRLGFNEQRSIYRAFVSEFLAFTYKSAISCLFPAFIFLVLGLSKLFDHSIIPRYDFLLIVCILAQVILYKSGIESRREVMVIFVFHLLGVLLELHKVNVGSWSYPEDAYTKVAGVPLYSGFMYSSVASYICQAWRHFDLKIHHWPRTVWVILIGLAIYGNFFSNAFVMDVRYFIIPLLFVVFWKTKVEFNTNGNLRQMPMLLSFILIGFFIWLAENIATFLGAWKYTYQHEGWQAVDLSKLTSWSLLVIVSIIIVAQLKRIRT